MEVWVDIDGYKGMYQVSDLGRVKSLKRIIDRSHGKKLTVEERILKPYVMRLGYIQYKLSKNGNPKSYQAHSLVAIAFLNHKPNGHSLVVDHIDNNPSNNKLNNLQVITQRENCSKDKKGKYVGVFLDKKANKWYAQIYIKPKKIHLGYFNTDIEAHNSYQNKLKEINNKNR